ncbi:unnamed protein product, partial [Prunus brigantina]
PERYYTPLKTNKEAILAIAGKELPAPRQGRHEYLGKRDEARYCKYHRTYGHSTDDSLLDKTTPPLFAFGGTRVQPLGNIHLPLTIGEYPRQATTVAHFVVVDCPSTYNVILGRPALNDLGLAISYRTLTLKFQTPHGVGTI